MKKIFLATIILFFSCQFCLATDITTEETDNIFTNDPQTNVELQGYLEYDDAPDETIYLENQVESQQNTVYLKSPTSKNGLNLKSPTKVGSKSLITSSIKQTPMTNVNNLDSASKFSTQEYSINPVNGSYSVKTRGISFGTTYNSDIDSSGASYSTGLFTKYDGKHFAFKTAFLKSTNSGYDSYTDRIYFAPELKLTKRLSLLDVMQTDMLQINRKNEVVLRYSPPIKKYADEVQFELGAGQSFYESNYINSSVRFSTKFKL